jgi:hypothetical protein
MIDTRKCFDNVHEVLVAEKWMNSLTAGNAEWSQGRACRYSNVVP